MASPKTYGEVGRRSNGLFLRLEPKGAEDGPEPDTADSDCLKGGEVLLWFALELFGCEFGGAACKEGSVIEPLRWFCKYSSGARGATGECLEAGSF